MIRAAVVLAALIAAGCSQEPTTGSSTKGGDMSDRQAEKAESRTRAMNSIEAARAADRAASVRDRADR